MRGKSSPCVMFWEGSKERLLWQQALRRQLRVVWGHEAHARATGDELSVNDGESPSIVRLEDVQVPQTHFLLHRLLSLLSPHPNDPIY